MDTSLTLEGRRQIANGKLKIEYVSFTDAATFYESDVSSGSSDATNRIYLENCNLPQDQIAFEANDAGRINPFASVNDVALKDGNVYRYIFTPPSASIFSGSSESLQMLSGEQFFSTAEGLLTSSLDNFGRLRIVATKDNIFEDENFKIGNKNITFTITDEHPIKDDASKSMNIDELEGMYSDVRFSNSKNFKFMPPVNKLSRQSDSSKLKPIGNYRSLTATRASKLSGNQLQRELSFLEKLGLCKTITFDPTSRSNNLIGQLFEIGTDTLKKLDVVDYGKFTVKSSTKHAFFVGKVLIDSRNVTTFVHLFTLVFG
jgi:hypothetical protein